MRIEHANRLVKLGAWLFQATATPSVLIARALKRIETYLLFSLALFSWFWIKGPKPYSAGEIVIWFSTLSPDLQAGTIAGLLTVLGFAVAFWSSHSNWLAQTRITLKMQAAEEIYAFFQQASYDMLTLRRSMELITDMQEMVMVAKEATHAEIGVTCALLNRYRDEYASSLERLKRSTLVVHELRTKHALLLSNMGWGLRSFDQASSILSNLAGIHALTPHPERFDRESLLQFVCGPQPNLYRDLLDKIDSDSYLMLAGPGGLRGTALKDLFPPSITSINETAKRVRQMLDEGSPLGRLLRRNGLDNDKANQE
ncbi:MAG TPA: hypothetical protein VMA55_17470 [Acidovorax sp.]|nr:hypothetical protein [Acidovorax sp.]